MYNCTMIIIGGRYFYDQPINDQIKKYDESECVNF